MVLCDSTADRGLVGQIAYASPEKSSKRDFGPDDWFTTRLRDAVPVASVAPVHVCVPSSKFTDRPAPAGLPSSSRSLASCTRSVGQRESDRASPGGGTWWRASGAGRRRPARVGRRRPRPRRPGLRGPGWCSWRSRPLCWSDCDPVPAFPTVVLIVASAVLRVGHEDPAARRRQSSTTSRGERHPDRRMGPPLLPHPPRVSEVLAPS